MSRRDDAITLRQMLDHIEAVDYDILWSVVTDDFPSLTTKIKTIPHDHRG